MKKLAWFAAAVPLLLVVAAPAAVAHPHRHGLRPQRSGPQSPRAGTPAPAPSAAPAVVRTHQVLVPGRYLDEVRTIPIPGRWEVTYEEVVTPGRYETVRRQVQVPGEWVTEPCACPVASAVFQRGGVQVRLGHVCQPQRRWVPPRTEVRVERVWIPETRERKPVRRWIPPTTRQETVRAWQPARYETRTVTVQAPAARPRVAPAPPARATRDASSRRSEGRSRR